MKSRGFRRNSLKFINQSTGILFCYSSYFFNRISGLKLSFKHVSCNHEVQILEPTVYSLLVCVPNILNMQLATTNFYKDNLKLVFLFLNRLSFWILTNKWFIIIYDTQIFNQQIIPLKVIVSWNNVDKNPVCVYIQERNMWVF